MRTFKLVRTEDFSGVSGTGEVAEGAQFSDGTCVMRWLTKTTSKGMYATVEDIALIHGHQGRTKVVFDDNGETVSDVEEEVESHYCSKCEHPHGYHTEDRGCTMPLNSKGQLWMGGAYEQPGGPCGCRGE